MTSTRASHAHRSSAAMPFGPPGRPHLRASASSGRCRARQRRPPPRVRSAPEAGAAGASTETPARVDSRRLLFSRRRRNDAPSDVGSAAALRSRQTPEGPSGPPLDEEHHAGREQRGPRSRSAARAPRRAAARTTRPCRGVSETYSSGLFEREPVPESPAFRCKSFKGPLGEAEPLSISCPPILGWQSRATFALVRVYQSKTHPWARGRARILRESGHANARPRAVPRSTAATANPSG
jgi:hypothetical protein